jgi:hypothetical protein
VPRRQRTVRGAAMLTPKQVMNDNYNASRRQ